MSESDLRDVAPADFVARILRASGADRSLVRVSPPRLHPWTATPWSVRWNTLTRPHRMALLRRLPPWLGFYTSGHTAPPALWLRTLDQVIAEAELLATICKSSAIDGVVSFAPVCHLYGFLLTFIVPASWGLPVWYHPMEAVRPLPHSEVDRPLIVAIPSALAYLEHRADELIQYAFVRIVHSTASLPDAGRRLARRLPPSRLDIVELLGSTETGLIAVRKVRREAAWQLASDVHMVHPRRPGTEAPLEVRGPRLARRPNSMQLASWQLDDIVAPVAPRRFRLIGRRSRLIKLNGRRVDLDWVEGVLRRAIPCRDLACLPVWAGPRGEDYEVSLVPDPQRAIDVLDARRISVRVLPPDAQPRRIAIVSAIARSATGKLRRTRPRR